MFTMKSKEKNNINPVYYKLIIYKAMDYHATYAHFAHRLVFKQTLSAILRLCLLSSAAAVLMANETGPKRFSQLFKNFDWTQ